MNKCLNCLSTLGLKGKKYCNNKCQREYEWKLLKLNFISTDNICEIKVSERQKDRIAKRYLIEKCGNICKICKWGKLNKYTNNVPIELEHIDGNSTNWKLKNLTLLCPNCHSLTKTYKGANRGNGRFFRRSRYLHNQSF